MLARLCDEGSAPIRNDVKAKSFDERLIPRRSSCGLHGNVFGHGFLPEKRLWILKNDYILRHSPKNDYTRGHQFREAAPGSALVLRLDAQPAVKLGQ